LALAILDLWVDAKEVLGLSCPRDSAEVRQRSCRIAPDTSTRSHPGAAAAMSADIPLTSNAKGGLRMDSENRL